MNQKQWNDYLQTVKRRHRIEIEEVKRLHREEIARIELEMAKAEPTSDFHFEVMRAIDVSKLSEKNYYHLAA